MNSTLRSANNLYNGQSDLVVSTGSTIYSSSDRYEITNDHSGIVADNSVLYTSYNAYRGTVDNGMSWDYTAINMVDTNATVHNDTMFLCGTSSRLNSEFCVTEESRHHCRWSLSSSDGPLSLE